VTTTARPTRAGRLPAPAAFYLQASIVLFLLASSSAPTPIYSIYQAEWGFTPIVTTVVFGTYAVAVLVSLLTVGSLSDHVGRRPVLLTALSVQAITMLVFASATGVTELLVARGIQGLATGAALGAVGAALLDLDKDKGTIANSIGAMAGTATGSIASGLLVQFLPAPTQLVYLVLFVVFVGQVVGVTLMAETAAPKPGALGSLRIQVGLPAGVRRPILLAIPALIAVWSLTGFYGSLGPSLVREITGSSCTCWAAWLCSCSPPAAGGPFCSFARPDRARRSSSAPCRSWPASAPRWSPSPPGRRWASSPGPQLPEWASAQAFRGRCEG